MRVCFMLFISLRNIILGKIRFARPIRLLIIAFFKYRTEHSLLKLRVQELFIRGFLLVEVVKLLLLVSMRTS